MTKLSILAAMAGVSAKAFAAGWAEGEMRAKANGAPEVVPGSHFAKGSVSFAASNAAVAFRLAVRGE